MNKIIVRTIVTVWVCLNLFGCSSGSEGAAANGSIALSPAETSLSGAAGEIAVFDLTAQHNVAELSSVDVTLRSSSGSPWKFALCYREECFISSGKDDIQKTVSLPANTAMQFEVKIFAPDGAGSGDSSTVEMSVMGSSNAQLKSALKFTTTVK